MDINTLIDTVNKFIVNGGYNPKDVIVTHGGALVLLGYIDTTTDIDVWVSRDIWVDEIVKGGTPVSLGGGVWCMAVTPDIDIHIGFGELYYPPVVNTGGWHSMDTQDLLISYEALNRPKDKQKIKMLQVASLSA